MVGHFFSMRDEVVLVGGVLTCDRTEGGKCRADVASTFVRDMCMCRTINKQRVGRKTVFDVRHAK